MDLTIFQGWSLDQLFEQLEWLHSIDCSGSEQGSATISEMLSLVEKAIINLLNSKG
jgi:hypothetical protein